MKLILPHHIAILQALDEHRGFTTRDVSHQSGMAAKLGDSKQTVSAACRTWLKDLQRRGYVEPVDDERPVVWVRTLAGSYFLANMQTVTKPAPIAGGAA